MSDNIKVAIKVRPLIRREKEEGLTTQWRIEENKIASIDPNSLSEPYCFDHIFNETDSTQSLFEIVAKPIIQNCMKGINGTIIAFGQTSSGKTHTMTGTDAEMGVIPLSIYQIFQQIESMARERAFLLRIAYIEIYNEKIFNLLDGKLSELKFRDTQNVGETKIKCHEIEVNSPETVLHYLAEGNAAKRMEETTMNERSSRSHTIFRITIQSSAISDGTEENDEGLTQISNLNLVDLAGSEKAHQVGTTSARIIEGAYLSRSLFSLGFVIKQVCEKGPETFINYRDSKLTHILQESLGGNSMTSIICTITPATVEETNYTLLFATRVKTIKNKPIVNETVSGMSATRVLQNEIVRLKQQLQNSKYRIEELERDIDERETKFVFSCTMRTREKTRRRSWCQSQANVNETSRVHNDNGAGGGGLLKSSSEHCLPNVNLCDRKKLIPLEYKRDFDLIDDMFLIQPLENRSNNDYRSVQDTCNELVETNKELHQSLPKFITDHDSTAKCAAVEKQSDFIETKYTLNVQQYRDLLKSVTREEKPSVGQSFGGNEPETTELNFKSDQKLLQAQLKSKTNLESYENLKANDEEQLSQTQIESERLEEENQNLVSLVDNLVDSQILPDVIQQLRSQIQLEHANAEQKRLIDEITGLKDELTTLSDKHNNLTDMYTESEKLLNESRETEKSLEHTNASLNGDIIVLQVKNEELKCSLEKATAFGKKYSSTLMEKQILEKQVKDLSVEMDNCNRTIEIMQAAHDEVQRVTKESLIENQERMDIQMRAELAAIEQRCEEEHKWYLQEVEAKQALELKSVQQMFEKNYNELEQTNSDLKSELKALHTEKISLQNMLADLEKTKAGMENHLKSQLNSARQEFSNLQSMVRELIEENIANLTENMTVLQDKNKELEQVIDTLKYCVEKTSEFEKKYSYRLIEKEILVNQVKELNAAMDSYEQKIQIIQADHDAIETQLRSELKEYKWYIKEIEETKSLKLESVRQLFELKYDELEQSKSTLEAGLKYEINLIQNKYKTLQMSEENLKFELKSIKYEVKNLQNTLKNLRDNKSSTEEELTFQLISLKQKYDEMEKALKLELKIAEQKFKVLQNAAKDKYHKLQTALDSAQQNSDRMQITIKTLEQNKMAAEQKCAHLKEAMNTKLEEFAIKLTQIKETSDGSKTELLKENFDLKQMNQTLFIELDTIKRQQNDRKFRRSITYDNNRSELLSVQRTGSLTDINDSTCNCNIMSDENKGISHNYNATDKNSPLCVNCSELSEKLTVSEINVIDLERQLAQSNIKLVSEKTTSNTSSQTTIQLAKPVNHVQTKDRLIQTDRILCDDPRDELHTIIERHEAEINRLSLRYEESKCLAIARRHKIDMLNDQIAKFQ